MAGGVDVDMSSSGPSFTDSRFGVADWVEDWRVRGLGRGNCSGWLERVLASSQPGVEWSILHQHWAKQYR